MSVESNNVCIGENNQIDDGVKIHDNVTIGSDNRICTGTTIYPNTTIGDNNVILDNNVLGEYGVDSRQVPTDGKRFGGLDVGNDNYFHVGNVVFSGLYGKTVIGNHNKFLSQVSIHHDNRIGDRVVFYPRAVTAGHCVLMDHATMGMNSCLQQRSVVGSYAMVGMGSVASHNVFPFYIYFGGRHQRLNTVKIPKDLLGELADKEEELRSAMTALKEGGCDMRVLETTDMPASARQIVSLFLSTIVIRKL